MSFIKKTGRMALVVAACFAGSMLINRPSIADDGGKADTQTTTRTYKDVQKDLLAVNGKLAAAMKGKSLSKEADRTAMSSEVVPLLQQQVKLYDEFIKTMPAAKMQLEPAKINAQGSLYLLDDDATKSKTDELAGSSSARQAVNGKSIQIAAKFLAAGKDAEAQGKVVDELEALDKQHSDDTSLTILTYNFSQQAASKEVKERLETIASDDMDNRVAKQIKTMLEGPKKLKAMENKPLAVAGKTVDGKDFTSDSLKGKVVLVDFWATWCGPCRAELPRVKEMYSKYHDKGLEILGVSNDFKASDLTEYIAKNEMPWTELFSADNASQHQWNDITTTYGINGIPTMFLIDKKGVLRTVEARELMEEMIPKLLDEK